MPCGESARRWPKPSAASWTCSDSCIGRWPTSRGACRPRRRLRSPSRTSARVVLRGARGPPGTRGPPASLKGMMRAMERTTTSRPRRRRTTKTAAPVEVVSASPAPLAPVAEPEPSLPIVAPEPVFVTRVPPPAPERLRPTTRHAIFFDVENTSNPTHIERVVGRLAIDHAGQSTEFFAVGNWRVIGHETGRVLARFGAQLLHSAPSTGVRDWSDLRIAVSAGVWLAGARPGDGIEIVSDDRAFDAVGDVAATLGVEYRRLSFRNLAGLRPDEVLGPREDLEPRGRRRRRGHRGRGRHERQARPSPPRAQHEPTVQAPPSPAPDSAELHTAPHDEIVGVARELIQTSERGSVTIDGLANALKARGFRRPPGSPRLITRLRRIRELEVSRNGLITLVPGAVSTPADEPESVGEMRDGAPTEAAADAAATSRRSRRRGRRGGRRHRRRSPEAAAAD